MATHSTPASSPWLQLCMVVAMQSIRRCSLPVHCTLSRKILPVPAPKNAFLLDTTLNVEYPSCLHTTRASRFPQKSSHTVPHVLPMQISTRPWLAFRPPTKRRSPAVQPWHLTPASSACTQLSMVRWRQESRVFSVPTHCTLSIWMGPVPWPKKAKENA